jgi:hypothetical protein
LLERVEPEALGLGCPAFADELVRCEAFEGLQPASEVVGGDEVSEMALGLLVAVVMLALDWLPLMVRLIRSTSPLVHGCLGFVVRCSMPSWAQAYSKA